MHLKAFKYMYYMPATTLRCSCFAGCCMQKQSNSPTRRWWWADRRTFRGLCYSRYLHILHISSEGPKGLRLTVSTRAEDSTYGRHGDHEKVDTVPVGQDILPRSPISKVWWVSAIFKLKKQASSTQLTENKLNVIGWLTRWIIPAAVSQTDTNIDINWANLHTFGFISVLNAT